MAENISSPLTCHTLFSISRSENKSVLKSVQFCAVERPFTSRCEKVMRDYSQASPADQNRRKEKHRVMSALQSL